MGSKQHHFVLVHGAGHGAWCWVKLAPVLEKAGHRVTTLDLASAGERPEVADDIMSIEQYDRPLEDLFASFPDKENVNSLSSLTAAEVILVGHSIGGVSLTRMSELFPRNISVAVYLAAFMPAPGVDIGALRASDPEFLPQPEGQEFVLHFKVEGGPPTSFEWPVERLRKHLYGKCSEEDFAFAADRLKAFPPVSVLFAPVPVTQQNYGSVQRVYVFALEDKAIDEVTQRKTIAMNPPMEVFEIDADHSPFFSAVEDTAKIFNDIAAKYDV